MEERRYLSASGAPIALRRRQHSASCRELAVRCPRLQLRSLSAVTSAVWLAAYGLFVLSENSVVLSAAIFITLVGLIVYLHFVKIDQESLLVIGSLGIQVTSSYASGKESTTFIEMGQVKDVVINEAIYMQKVIYYLCILLQDPGDPQGVSEVVPLFQQHLQGEALDGLYTVMLLWELKSHGTIGTTGLGLGNFHLHAGFSLVQVRSDGKSLYFDHC
ncbi:phosphatidylinositol N-acetylglucosaminyltransferase subunit H isoform 2-T2 [Porphyrio hochstetteri]